ncbi:alpha/beta hydrolase [Paenibacillus rhizovicinus]|uniref:Alpha/beta hydrolase n=1 Tax=Paenibacillus rhizovicinus TaxID=2704463 RepID=A0A6C0P6X2_9BACL|nr:alpha/beta hydrolase [Paenibacillus rhizovicinus]QHW34096.1 alpha/beta hydrolase [Paenibacillus rhizovicinus]
MELELELPLMPLPAPPQRDPVWKRVTAWLIYRGRMALRFDTPIWRAGMIGLWIVFGTALVITALGMPTGIGIVFDAAFTLVVGTMAMGLIGLVAAYLLSLCYIPIPRLTTGALAFAGYAIWFIGNKASLGDWMSLLFAIVLPVAGLAGGLFVGMLAHRRVPVAFKIALVVVITCAGLSFDKWPMNVYGAIPADAQLTASEPEVAQIMADSPAATGSYAVKSFTYGSGSDSRRNEFASGAELKSASVDASAYIHSWKWVRSLFWGFDETKLPINGRVWMPEGSGKFPLVLIVHGNHLMEQSSDDGYAYLGEMLASRGFIAVSVDENFLNYSFWGNIPDNDYKVRAWILLKHLQQIASFNEQAGSPFYHRVDLGQVALIGHSRGGQAVAMAADPSKWFAEDKSLAGMDDIHIQAVIAIAPTDTNVDKQKAQLKDTYYLSLQGASDGDVDTFGGERQYLRSSFTPGSDRFKATLYIGGANHSRFNTSWGTMDDSLPGGLLLNKAEMIEASDQRQIAKVYVSAFLETALHGNRQYKRLFSDYRTGEQWLPATTYMNRYEDGSFVPLARIDGDYDKVRLDNGVKASSDRLQWSEADAEDRDGNDKGTRGAVLQWKQGDGSYTLKLPKSVDALHDSTASSAQELVFNMTNLERDLPGFDSNASNGGSGIPLPAVEIELQSRNGAAVRMPLSAFKAVMPLPYTHFTLFPWMEKHVKDGKYKEPTEPVFQTYSLPFDRFQVSDGGFDPAHLSRITFYFTSDQGKVMLDDIGIADVLNK